ncbi:MAG: type IX secretion system membrane protein PorP/SprF [Tunicatimonas sp.]|uniref:PorP/SprF family type IX secretion system membrane protein n=1 Tax=Tunicatimonas sp. TaxID=1940096 RepID=UPI003C780E5F
MNRNTLHTLFFILLIGLMALPGATHAQQRPIFSQYMFNGLVLNPAYAGNQKQWVISMVHRDQWVNVEGAPKTNSLITHTALENRPVGLGLIISNDRIGIHDDYSMFASYSYKLKLAVGTLSLGLQAGGNYTQSNFELLRRFHLNDPTLTGTVTRFSPNFGTGAFYSNSTTYAGISVPYLLNNKVYNSADVISQATERRYYFLTGGHVFSPSPSVKLKPSTLIRYQEGQPLGMDLNMNVFLQDVINLGGSYRSGDSMIILMEIILNRSFSFGYTYDHTISRIRNYTDGTHEFMLSYRLNIGESKCHSYF